MNTAMAVDTTAFSAPVLLELGVSSGCMTDRLLTAAARIDRSDEDRESIARSSLRPEQQSAAVRFGEFLLDMATQPTSLETSPFGRIVLPPRTGKTVIAAHLVALSGLKTTFIVPTRNLVRQTAEELSRHLPGVPIGVFYGGMKRTVEHGVNIATYNILQHRYHNGTIPRSIGESALVIVDEAHHAMTKERMAFLENGFSRSALRIGLTATPDYNAQRLLAHHFPRLISEVSLYEAFEMDLLAPLRLWVAEVDVDASKVRLIAGDYDADSLGRLMSAAPIFRAAELFRYNDDNLFVPALISCSSRRQALDLKAYLDRHRPVTRPKPALILGETPEDCRIDTLNRFENGTVDTLIQVGVLTEGWNSPRCKLLIDVAPSLSRVRATQKYFRVMTRNGHKEARIYVIIPSHLSATPILPTDLFGNPLEDYECGTLVSVSKKSGTLRKRQQYLPSPIEGVRLRKRVVFAHSFEKPTLDRRNLPDLRRVVASSEAFDVENPCGFLAFHGLHFNHRKFVGTGGLLLDHCGVRDRFAYQDFMTRLFPEVMAGSLLGTSDPLSQKYSNRSDLVWLLEEGNESPALRWNGWVTLGGHLEDIALSPEEAVMRRETYTKLWTMIDGLKPRERSILVEYFGLDRRGVSNMRELGDMYQISSSRVAQIIAKAIRKLRYRNWRDSILT